MQVQTLNSYSKIKNFCIKLLGNNTDAFVFYRGTKVNYLLPSIVPDKNKFKAQQLLKIEKELLKEFKKINCLPSYKNRIYSDWRNRVTAREHGLASSLLDWSNTFHTALDFATSSIDFLEEDKYVYLWALVVPSQNLFQCTDTINISFDKIDKSKLLHNVLPATEITALAIRRQNIQGGSFLIQEQQKIVIPINEQNEFQDKLFCIHIPIKNLYDLRSDMINDGINIHASLMIKDNDELDNKCRELNKQYLYSPHHLYSLSI